MSVATVGCLALYTLFVFHFRAPVSAKHSGGIVIVLLVIVSAIAAAGYLYAFERFTFDLPTTGERIVVGCGFTPEARLVANSLLVDTGGECPGHYEDLLEKCQYEAHVIWTKSSLSMVKLIIAGLWSTFFICLAMLVGERIRILLNKEIRTSVLSAASYADVFISYSHEDRSRAQALVTALRRDGLAVWWDCDIPPGETWDQLIENRLHSARNVVVLWTTISVTKTWVREEALDAHRRNVMVPVLLDEVSPPLGFRHLQAVSLIGWTGDSSAASYRHLFEILLPRESVAMNSVEENRLLNNL
jgi:hypothetical protein